MPQYLDGVPLVLQIEGLEGLMFLFLVPPQLHFLLLLLIVLDEVVAEVVRGFPGIAPGRVPLPLDAIEDSSIFDLLLEDVFYLVALVHRESNLL